MSLSFVSSSVLTSTDGVSHNEETDVSSKELDAVRQRNANDSKPLFEQLRGNLQEQEDLKAEQERARIRGTLALNEEDVAHLNALNRSKLESEFNRKMELEREIAIFRAAKEERRTGHVVVDDDDDVDDDADVETNQNHHEMNDTYRIHTGKTLVSNATLSVVIPKIISKRRRNEVCAPITHPKKKREINTVNQQPVANEVLGDLLGGYGSSSDEDNDTENDGKAGKNQ